MSKENELALNSTSKLALTGNALGSEFGHQDYGTIQLNGVRLVDEKWLMRMVQQRDELLAALKQIENSNPDSTVRGLQQAAAVATFDTKTTGPTIADLQEFGQLPKPESKGAEDAARRVSACLAACSGMTTKALEAMPLPFSKLLSHQFQEVIDQRDELLAALEKAVDAEFEFGGPWPTEEELRAVIAKAKSEQPAAEHFTSITKGGTYERLGAIRGAGQLKGLAGIAYRDVATGGLFIRTPECFAARMKKVEQGEGGAV